MQRAPFDNTQLYMIINEASDSSVGFPCLLTAFMAIAMLHVQVPRVTHMYMLRQFHQHTSRHPKQTYQNISLVLLIVPLPLPFCAPRYQKAYRDLAKRHPSFRERSETTDLIVEISLQPFKSFAPDGVILFSDILTPLPAVGVPFEIDDNKGPIIDTPIRSLEQVGCVMLAMAAVSVATAVQQSA